jgi:hypothetical protein
VAETLWVLVEQAAIRTRDDTPTLAAGSGEALEARLAHLLGQPAPRAQPWRSLLLSGALLGLLLGLEWIFVQAGMTNVLWYLEHTPLSVCSIGHRGLPPDPGGVDGSPSSTRVTQQD